MRQPRRSRRSIAANRLGTALRVGALLAAALAPATAHADELSEAVAAAAGPRDTELGSARFATPAALCRGYVAWATAANAAAAPSHDESIVAHTPRCFAETKDLPFTGTRAWQALRVVHADDGVGSASRLVARTATGWVLTPMAWNERDPRDPGCPSIVRDIAVDGAGVQNGRLVVIMAGERTTYVDPVGEDDSGVRAELVRTPYWATDEGGVVRFASTQTFLVGGTLGSKVQPGPRNRWVAWATLPWSGYRDLHIDASGTIRVTPDGPVEL